MSQAVDRTAQRKDIRDSVQRICSRFDAAYWRAADENAAYPEAFVSALTEGGFLGIAMPEDVGGAGLGATEAAIMMQTISQSGAGFTGASAVHMNIFAPMPIAVFGTPAQKHAFLPPLIRGQDRKDRVIRTVADHLQQAFEEEKALFLP